MHSHERVESDGTYEFRSLLYHPNDLELKNAPSKVYVAGDVELIRRGRRVAVVGSRNASESGLQRVRVLVRELVSREIVVVSGLAKGIDTAAHEAAIEFNGKTAAILGTPLDSCSPTENRKLQNRIMTDHVALSQFESGIAVAKHNFVLRSRLMALLSDATVIVEASESSGTRHQAREALRLGRDVFLMSNVVHDSNLAWVSDLMQYGAHELTRDTLNLMLDELPAYTDRVDFDRLPF